MFLVGVLSPLLRVVGGRRVSGAAGNRGVLLLRGFVERRAALPWQWWLADPGSG